MVLQQMHNILQENWFLSFFDRPWLPAFSLATDTSVLTAIGNDYGYEHSFARQIDAVGKKEMCF